jgi:hypothetical protein
MHANPTHMIAFERPGRLDLEIDEVTYHRCLAVDKKVVYH